MKKVILSLMTIALLTSCEPEPLRVQMEDGEVICIKQPDFTTKIGDTVVIKSSYGYLLSRECYGRYTGEMPYNSQPCVDYISSVDSSQRSFCVFYHKGVVTK